MRHGIIRVCNAFLQCHRRSLDGGTFLIRLMNHNSFSAFDRIFQPFSAEVRFFESTRFNSIQKSSRSCLVRSQLFSVCSRFSFRARRIERGSDRTRRFNIMIHSDWIIAHRHSWSFVNTHGITIKHDTMYNRHMRAYSVSLLDSTRHIHSQTRSRTYARPLL